jgi:hypothetical protein
MKKKTIIDHSSSEISTKKPKFFFRHSEGVETEENRFYKGTSYRHL